MDHGPGSSGHRAWGCDPARPQTRPVLAGGAAAAPHYVDELAAVSHPSRVRWSLCTDCFGQDLIPAAFSPDGEKLAIRQFSSTAPEPAGRCGRRVDASAQSKDLPVESVVFADFVRVVPEIPRRRVDLGEEALNPLHVLGSRAPDVVGPSNAESIFRVPAGEALVVICAWLRRVVGDVEDLAIDSQAQAIWRRFASTRFHGSIQPMKRLSGHRQMSACLLPPTAGGVTRVDPGCDAGPERADRGR